MQGLNFHKINILMEKHVMDRFDSFLFVAPTLYLILQVLPIFTTIS